ncbi:MAG: hypothetical protein IJ737_05655 [Ruminococcus sp.]|nr:hypothetical protein [Ruminococcus sp.]
MITDEEIDGILLRELAATGSPVTVAKRLPTVLAQRRVGGMTLEQAADGIMRVGMLLTAEPDHMVGVVKAGAMNMNPAVIIAAADGGDICFAAYAKEGLIKQHTSEKAIKRVLGEK